MDNSLRRLRKEAGFTSAAKFAESVGIPAPTYARYEQTEDGPETSMPLKNAWIIADALGCSIDHIVGREHIEPDQMRGDIQKFYDGLSDISKSKVDEFFGYIAYLEEQEAERQREQEEIRRIQQVQLMERMFFNEIREDPAKEDAIFWSAERCRTEFEQYISERMASIVAKDRDELSDRINRDIRLQADLASIDESGEVHFDELDEDKEASVSEVIDRATDELIQKTAEETVKDIMVIYDKVHPRMRSNREPKVLYSLISFDKDQDRLAKSKGGDKE